METVMRLRGAVLGLLVTAGLALGAGQASAAPGGNQAGDTLVNVQISDTTLAVPLAVAANLCDINVNALALQVDDGDTTCTATAESVASPSSNNGNNGNGGNQAGNSLVNVQIDDLTILVPIALAANLCDLNVNVLAVQLRTGAATCTATADSLASA